MPNVNVPRPIRNKLGNSRYIKFIIEGDKIILEKSDQKHSSKKSLGQPSRLHKNHLVQGQGSHSRQNRRRPGRAASLHWEKYGGRVVAACACDCV